MLLLTLLAAGVVMVCLWFPGSRRTKDWAGQLQTAGFAAPLTAADLPFPIPLQAVHAAAPRTGIVTELGMEEAEGPGAELAASDPPASLALIAGWIRDLRDDDIAWNGERAAASLRSERSRHVEPALLDALFSDDYQQRQWAACLLIRRGAEPSQRLLEVCVEALANDAEYGRGDPFEYNATRAARFLSGRSEPVWPLLSRTLDGPDPQARLFAAVLLSLEGYRGRSTRVCDILTAHLGDNRLTKDAMLSAATLYKRGPGVLVHLAAAERVADAQALETLRLIRLDLLDPPATRGELEGRAELQSLSKRYHDPVVELDAREILRLLGSVEDSPSSSYPSHAWIP